MRRFSMLAAAAAPCLGGTPCNRGASERGQDISTAGNRRVRTMPVELAWSWLS